VHFFLIFSQSASTHTHTLLSCMSCCVLRAAGAVSTSLLTAPCRAEVCAKIRFSHGPERNRLHGQTFQPFPPHEAATKTAVVFPFCSRWSVGVFVWIWSRIKSSRGSGPGPVKTERCSWKEAFKPVSVSKTQPTKLLVEIWWKTLHAKCNKVWILVITLH